MKMLRSPTIRSSHYLSQSRSTKTNVSPFRHFHCTVHHLIATQCKLHILAIQILA